MDGSVVRHIATLAQLSLTQDEERELGGDLERILAFVAELEAVPTADVPPMTHANLADAAAWREDVVTPGLDHDEAMSGAPRVEGGGFAVPGFVG
ncbi:MAG: Asp-tRNA(Asn)/Glu-tRNA(Gln) amidotransferase subunit GatC [Myxococcales bacterium]|nr:Asp-tRNA(Asn)/Glu-tRNA(Gln) amidotransferase subunit GatC [Myxococcales bacterium]